MATWHFYDQVTEPAGWAQIVCGAPARHAPVGRSRSYLGCEAALAALRAAGGAHPGLPYLSLRAIVMTVGQCGEAAADQQLRTYVRHRVGVRDLNMQREWNRSRAGTAARIPYQDQIWADREHCGSPEQRVG